MSPYYVVFKGKNPRVYLTWHECSEQVLGFKNVIYKKCSNYEQAISDFNASVHGKQHPLSCSKLKHVPPCNMFKVRLFLRRM